MPANTTILYSTNEKDAWFDIDYYIKVHMPLVVEKWGPHGLLEWQVLKFMAPSDGPQPAFSIGAFCTWESLEGAKKAVESPESKVVFDDVVNYSNIKPVHHLTATVEGSWRK